MKKLTAFMIVFIFMFNSMAFAVDSVIKGDGLDKLEQEEVRNILKNVEERFKKISVSKKLRVLSRTERRLKKMSLKISKMDESLLNKDLNFQDGDNDSAGEELIDQNELNTLTAIASSKKSVLKKSSTLEILKKLISTVQAAKKDILSIDGIDKYNQHSYPSEDCFTQHLVIGILIGLGVLILFSGPLFLGILFILMSGIFIPDLKYACKKEIY